MNYTFVRNTLSIILLMFVALPFSAAQDNNLQRLDYSQTPKTYTIGKVDATDLINIYKENLLSSLDLIPGDQIVIPGEKLKDTYKFLWNQKHYSDVKIKTTFRGDTVDIFIALKERLRVADWRFEGVKTSEAKDLKEKLKYRKYSEYSDFLMNTYSKLIREYYDEKAFRFAKIDYEITADTSANARSTYRVVTFKVDRGPRVRVGEIQFEGNDNLSSKSLAKSMKKTKKRSWKFFVNSRFKDKEYPNDLVLLSEHMRSKGYRDGRIVADSLYKVDDKHIGVWIKLDEGKKYYYRNISWIGNSVYTTQQLQDLLQFRKGDTYDSETFETRLGTPRKMSVMERSISGMYKDEGYLAFQINPVETVAGDSVDVEVRIFEYKPFHIGDVTFQGNTRTNDHVIRREIQSEPGDLYSQSMIMRTYQRLSSMTQFEATSLLPNTVPNFQNETVDLQYTLKETSNDQLELSGGWGGGMFIASVGLNFTNVAIRKAFDPKAWRPYPAGDNQQLSLKLQSNGTYYQAFSVSFTEPWLGGRKPNALSVALYSSRQSNAYYAWSKPTQFFTATGGSVSLGKRLKWPDPYFTMSAGLSAQSYKMKDWNTYLISNGVSSTVALNLAIARNSVDDPYQYPTTGSNISLSLAITPPFSALDNKDYANTAMSNQDRYRWVEYHKWKLNAQWFTPLTFNGKLVLMARAQYGYLGYYNTNKRSPFEGFIVGGDGLAGYSMYGAETIGLRGYKNSTLTPNAEYGGGEYASIYSKYTAELRYPFVREGSTLVYGLAFLEAGNAFTSINDYNPFNLKRSAGFGVRIFLPIVGMLGIDWGYGFDRPTANATSGKKGEIHFTMGMQL